MQKTTARLMPKGQTTLDKLDAAEETLRKAATAYQASLQTVANDLERVAEDLRRVGELAVQAATLSIPEGMKPGAVVALEEGKTGT